MENNLEYTPKKCWEHYASVKERETIFDLADRYLDFLSRCKNERETAKWEIGRAHV